eukprot:366026-Chlamydomonas_euryale.AAC.13
MQVPRDKSASALEVDVPMPRYVQRVHCDARMGGGPDVSEFLERTRTLTWRFKRCGGGQEFCLRARLTLERPYSPSLRSDIGPINLKFTIPAFSVSRLNLKYLQIVKKVWKCDCQGEGERAFAGLMSEVRGGTICSYRL